MNNLDAVFLFFVGGYLLAIATKLTIISIVRDHRGDPDEYQLKIVWQDIWDSILIWKPFEETL